jgi:hypothetical protein
MIDDMLDDQLELRNLDDERFMFFMEEVYGHLVPDGRVTMERIGDIPSEDK